MQPRFALRISDDGLSLLDRTAAGWAEVGSAAFDGPDLDAAVAALVAEASARAPKGFATLLVLPDSQVLYTRVDDAGGDAETQRDRIGAALEGRTPYDLADLVFDWTMEGTTAHVAVVARETLDEAEGFAAARGLNPIGFAASPAAGVSPAVASFGTTALAATLLKRGRTLAPETAPVVAMAQDGMAADTPEPPREDPAPQPEPEPAPAPQPEPAPQEEPDPAPLPEPPPPTPTEVPEPPPEPEPQPEPLPIPLREPEPVREPEPLPVPSPDPGPDPTPDPVPEPLDVPGFDPVPEPVTMQQPASVLDPGIAEVDEAPMALDVPLEAEPARPRPLAAALPIDDVPPAPSAAASLAFASRRDVAASVSAAAPRPVGAASRPIPAPAAKPVPPRVADRPVERPAALRPAPKLGYADPVEPKEGRGLRGLGAFVTAPVLPGRGKRKAQVSAPAAAASPATAATAPAAAPASGAARPAAKPTEFRGRPWVQRGKPKYLGLILTGVLLVFLAIAAALSSYFVTDADPAADAGIAPASDGAAVQAAATPVAPEPVTPTPVAPAPDATAAPQAVAGTEAAPAESETASAAPAVDATDMAATVAPESATQDEITLSSAESAPQAVDAVALPVPGARGDPPPAAQVPPPPFGTVYQFDENGLIRPTPEGIVSPEGVLLVAGRPAQVPPPRPEGLVPAPEAEAAAAGTPDPAAPEAATGFPADPALADARPQRRPEGLAPAPAAEPAPEDETNLIPAAARLVSLRPPARPDAILAAGLQAQQAAIAASASLAAPDPNRSVLALSVSRRPAARPADMARAVEAAVAAAARQPEPEPAPEPAPPAEITPETEEEPELASAAPDIPVTANVARQATLRNAIDLGDLNLIGIYGTQSDRYALVRQPNGRFVKVRVGDRLDGGRVAAITASEVRYEKRGRMQVLEMPRG